MLWCDEVEVEGEDDSHQANEEGRMQLEAKEDRAGNRRKQHAAGRRKPLDERIAVLKDEGYTEAGGGLYEDEREEEWRVAERCAGPPPKDAHTDAKQVDEGVLEHERGLRILELDEPLIEDAREAREDARAQDDADPTEGGACLAGASTRPKRRDGHADGKEAEGSPAAGRELPTQEEAEEEAREGELAAPPELKGRWVDQLQGKVVEVVERRVEQRGYRIDDTRPQPQVLEAGVFQPRVLPSVHKNGDRRLDSLGVEDHRWGVERRFAAVAHLRHLHQNRLRRADEAQGRRKRQLNGDGAQLVAITGHDANHGNDRDDARYQNQRNQYGRCPGLGRG